MKLQIALDTLDLPQCIELLDVIHPYIDIIEVGTPFIIEEGLKPVREFKKRYPNCEVLADVKIMDAGEYEAEKCFEAGADIVTVLGVTHDETIKGAVKAAKKYQGKIMIDMIGISDFSSNTKRIDALGVDYICVHTAFDLQSSGDNPLAELLIVNQHIVNAKSAVAGGLKLETIGETVAEQPAIIVVGGGITNQTDKLAVCRKIKELMH